jgi:hypothetical protein
VYAVTTIFLNVWESVVGGVRGAVKKKAPWIAFYIDHGIRGIHEMKHEGLSEKIIGAAQAALYDLKPGLDEKLYENALEMMSRSHPCNLCNPW